MNGINNSRIIREIILFVESQIYKVSTDGIHQRLLWYKIQNLIRKYPNNLRNLATIISIGDEDIIRDVLECVDFSKIIDLVYLILEDEYEFDDDLNLIRQVNLIKTSNLLQLPTLIKCDNCNKFNICIPEKSTNSLPLCSCGFIPI